MRSGWIVAFVLMFSIQATPRPQPAAAEAAMVSAEWPELERAMDKLHVAMRSVKSSNANDVDFVRLMIPHHEAAIDMAKAQLLYGRDPQMRRLAQEIVTDQQSEIELMRLWLKTHEPKK